VLELQVTFDGRSYTFQPGQPVRIGRSNDSSVVVSDPTVSRQHAQLVLGPDGWVFENLGQSPSYAGGQPVTRVVVTQAMEFNLASPRGPVLRIEPVRPVRAADPQAVQAAAQHAPQTARLGAPPPGNVGDFAAPGRAAPPISAQPAPSRDELATAFQILVPVRSWLTDPGWRQGLRLMVIPYALLPLIFIALFASSGNLTTPGWAYSLYVAPLWAIAFWLLIRPGDIRRLEVQIGIGLIVWVLIWMQVVTVNVNGHLGTAGQPLSFFAALGVGFNEEITKALPVLLAALILLKYRSTKLDVRMWMFLGTIAGLAFGVREQAVYTLEAILGIAHAQVNSQAVVAVLSFAERVFVDGFQHAVWAGVSGFFMGIAVNYPRRRVPLILLGLAIPAVLHGLNDWSGAAFNSLWAPITIQAISLFLFLGYTMSAASIERRVRRTPMFRGQSILAETFNESKDVGGG
jgi:RsiW-degrading membrane proteinase PrsW (M82 family)